MRLKGVLRKPTGKFSIDIFCYRESTENSYCTLQRSAGRKESHVLTKRATLLESFFNFFNFNIGNSDEKEEAQNHRVPRKIRDNDDDVRESKCKLTFILICV